MEKLTDVISSLKAQERQMRVGLLDFENTLVKNLQGVDTYGVSETIILQFETEEEHRYANLYFDGENIVFLIRESRLFDYDVFDNNTVFQIADIPLSWGIKIATAQVLDSLIANIYNNLTETFIKAKNANSCLSEYKNLQFSALDNDLVSKISESSIILNSWTEARNTIGSDPEYSLAQTSSFLESVCRKVIEEREALPASKEMTTLVNTAFNLFTNYPSDAVDDMRKLNGGVKSIFSGIGSMRTKFSVAHGKSESFEPVSKDIVTLANHLAGAVALYLICQSEVGK